MQKYLKRDDLIFLLRHGEIVGSSVKKYIGITEVKLSEKGIKQAQYWKNHLNKFELKGVYTSPLGRCIETAEILGFDYKIKDSLKEIDLGVWEGMSFDYVKKRFPDLYDKRGKSIDTFRTLNGESFTDLYNRTVPLLEKLKNYRGNFVIITHAGIMKTIKCYIENIPLKNVLKIKSDYSELIVMKK